MSKLTIENAIITSTMLGREDHGIMTCSIGVEFAGGGCGFGGYAFDRWIESEKRRVGDAFGIEFIAKVLDTVGVELWEALKGKHVRVETSGWGGGITRIGNIIKDKWFDLKALAEAMKEQSK